MKLRLTDLLASRYAATALDFIFGSPVFTNSRFTARTGIPHQTVGRFSRILLKEGLLQIVREAAGRRPAIYRFEPLMQLIRV